MRLPVNTAWFVSISGLFILFLGVFAVRMYAQTNAGDGMMDMAGSVAGLRLPLGYHENGQLKAQLKAEKATVQESGKIFASNITSEFFTVEGNLDILMTAEDCLYDKLRKTATSNSRVRVEKKGVVITGRGYEWDASNQFVCVTSDVKVVINRTMVSMKTLKGKLK